MEDLKTRYLERLAELYPTVAAAFHRSNQSGSHTEPAESNGTFSYGYPRGVRGVFPCSAKNGSGAVRRKVNDVFGNTLCREDKRSLATLIYYPQRENGPDSGTHG